MSLKISPIWKGVFSSFSEAGGDLDAFDSDTWLKKQRTKIKKALEYTDSDGFFSQDYPLSLVVTLLLSHKSNLSVLDIGGGMGLQYLEIVSHSSLAKEKLDYYVVDGKACIQNRPKELDLFNNLFFYSNINDIREPIDVVHMGSTLQYIENWCEFLQNVCHKFKPQYIVMSDVLAGDIPTFVSHQNFYNKKIPIMMLNFDELKSTLKGLSYTSIYETNFQSSTLMDFKLAVSALPEKYKLSNSKSIIFQRESM